MADFLSPGSRRVELAEALQPFDTAVARGRIVAVQGVLVRARLPTARIGEFCTLRDPRGGRCLRARIVGLDGDEALLSPIGDISGLSTHTEVIAVGGVPDLGVGPELLGRVIDPLGRSLEHDHGQMIPTATRYPLHATPPGPMTRQVACHALTTGIRAIDGLLTLAHGQRIGLFGGPGVGKSSLMMSMIEHSSADVMVLGMVGERGREVRELLEHRMNHQARARTVAVVATSDRPAAERVMAAEAATCVAEYFRDEGKNVLLVIDSVTRYARAQREVGLAAGEPPTRRGYPPSFFAAMPRLLERAGRGTAIGSITGIYTVLTEGDDALDPVAEETMSLLDGHIVLSDDLAQRNHFPAIDVLRSRSRLMAAVVESRHAADAAAVRDALARLEESALLRQVGEYKAGADPTTDRAVQSSDKIMDFLRQDSNQTEAFDTTRERLRTILP
jgi:type III secretion protein N (ATPase)